MGGLYSRLRTQQSTVEILENIDKDIQALEEFREKNQRSQKLWIGRLIFYSSILYLISCLMIYFCCVAEDLTTKLMETLPLLVFPVLVWLVRKMLLVWFSKRTERNNEALEDLKAQKKKILEEVMEKETYKTAKLILERFDPDSKKTKELEQLPAAGISVTPRPGQELRQRSAAKPFQTASTPQNPSSGVVQAQGVGHAATPGAPQVGSAPGGPPEKSRANILQKHPPTPMTPVSRMGLHPPGPPLARPILPRERGVMDKFIELLVGDGPQNRYALICQQCFSHNGMALKEEFEYIAFRCAYCFFLNPARKTRPQAPRIPELRFENRSRRESQSSHSDEADVQDILPADDPAEEKSTSADESKQIPEQNDANIADCDTTLFEGHNGLVTCAEEPKQSVEITSQETTVSEQDEDSLMETE
ncbi:endoplasmic reticulum junction formation protein lunapark [Protopterus annectens]|uniref:endoplasmic reticulum junction formation protein lunapark n=1 Tax=Protopterus annectens TaxID=7888 RepID=UPI001CF99D52|nr:endoplasmic reticulum junction formation protein lunapark [Protopterus annectens]